MNNTELFGNEIISTYSRAQALADGVLVDISKMANEAGFVVPVAVTAAVWSMIEDIPEKYGHENIDGRAWDMVWMASRACKNAQGGGRINYDFILHVNNSVEGVRARPFKGSGRGFDKDQVRLSLVSGPGDNIEHVITIMLPDEN